MRAFKIARGLTRFRPRCFGGSKRVRMGSMMLQSVSERLQIVGSGLVVSFMFRPPEEIRLREYYASRSRDAWEIART